MMNRKQIIDYRLVTVFAVFVLCFGAAAFGVGTTLFSDNFDSNTTVSTVVWPDLAGDYDPDNPAVGRWEVSETNIEGAQVSNYTYTGMDPNIIAPSSAYSGSKYLVSGYHSEYYGDENHAGNPKAIFLPYTDVTVDFWIYCYDDMYSQIAAYAADGTGVFLVRIYTYSDITGDYPVIEYRDGALAQWIGAFATWTADSWNHIVLDVSCTSGTITMTVNGGAPEQIGWYEAATNIASVLPYGMKTSFYDDVQVTADAEPVVLTMQATPSQAGIGTTPIAGTYNCPTGAVVSINARYYVGNGGVYYGFDHWTGDVANPNSRSTTVTMNTAETVTAVYNVLPAIPLFDDDFENNTTVSTVAWPDASGDFDPDKPDVGAWIPEEASDVELQVSSYAGSNPDVPAAAHSGDNYMISGYHYDTYGNWGHFGLPGAVMLAPVTEAVIDCWVYLTGNIGTDYEMYITVYDSDRGAGKVAILLAAEGTSGAVKYVSGGWQTAVSAMTPQAWNHILLEMSITDHLIYLTVNGGTPEVIGWYEDPSDLGYVRFYSDYTGYFDDIKITTHGPSATLTIGAIPGVVSTVIPTPGTHSCPLNAVIPVTASRYVNCPDVYAFDHWTGDVADPGSATTTVTMNTSKTVTAVFVDDRVCGDECHPYPAGDLNQSCKVDLTDFSILAGEWLDCTAPDQICN